MRFDTDFSSSNEKKDSYHLKNLRHTSTVARTLALGVWILLLVVAVALGFDWTFLHKRIILCYRCIKTCNVLFSFFIVSRFQIGFLCIFFFFGIEWPTNKHKAGIFQFWDKKKKKRVFDSINNGDEKQHCRMVAH